MKELFYDCNKLKEDVLFYIFRNIEVELDYNDEEKLLLGLNDLVLNYKEIVDEVLKNHWNNTLKSKFNDRLLEVFLDSILGFTEISEYDALILTKISKFFEKNGVHELKNFDILITSKIKRNLHLDEKIVDQILQKLTF